MQKVYLLTESGGEYGDRWEINISASLNKEKLDKIASDHNKKQKGKRRDNKTEMNVEELELI